MIEHPKLFISYSHDSYEHKAWVKKIATDLRQHMGVDVIFDQWDLRIGSDLSLFMEQGLSSSDLVMCVCSDQYVLKTNQGVGGTGYEKMILTRDLLKNTSVDYIIPIMRGNDSLQLPIFLGTKMYLDFTNDNNYLEKLGELTARIYNEDIVVKPPLGESPYLQSITNEIIVKTMTGQSAYHNPNMSDAVSFDFKNNSGEYTIGSGEYEFRTKWSECGARSIYGYKDNVKMIGYLFGISEIPQNRDFSNFDFTSRTREVGIGEVLIWMNSSGKFAATLITEISVKSRGDISNVLSFDYKIYI